MRGVDRHMRGVGRHRRGIVWACRHMRGVGRHMRGVGRHRKGVAWAVQTLERGRQRMEVGWRLTHLLTLTLSLGGHRVYSSLSWSCRATNHCANNFIPTTEPPKVVLL